MSIDNTNLPQKQHEEPLPSPWQSNRFRLFFTARSASLLADGMLMVSSPQPCWAPTTERAASDTRWPRG